MTVDLSSFKQVLTDNGHHVTKAREVTFELLQSPEPQSMKVILSKATGKVDRVSVYRNIDLFEKLGIAKRIYVGWKYSIELTDQFMPHHHHLTCLTCGRIIDIQDEQHINSFIDSVSESFGFTPVGHQFEVDGYCKSCVK